jgi:hypothetical protein
MCTWKAQIPSPAKTSFQKLVCRFLGPTRRPDFLREDGLYLGYLYSLYLEFRTPKAILQMSSLLERNKFHKSDNNDYDPRNQAKNSATLSPTSPKNKANAKIPFSLHNKWPKKAIARRTKCKKNIDEQSGTRTHATFVTRKLRRDDIKANRLNLAP